MDDQFLHDLRREPRPEFARQLRDSLRRRTAAGAPAPGRAAGRWVALAASAALVSIAFTIPSVRAGAQAFLDMFRVVSITGISFDATRLEAIEADGFDLPALLGGQVEVLAEAGAPVTVGDLDEAAALAGSPVRMPTWMPPGAERGAVVVSGEHAARITVSADDIRALLDVLAIDDLSVPLAIDGAQVTVRVPPVVQISYRSAAGAFDIVQARTPEASFPTGFDLPALAEIGLRVLGLDREDAYRLAQSVDWRTTLIVPVPAAEASFQHIDVAGNDGLLIEPVEKRTRLLLWSSGDQVFAIGGRLGAIDMLDMAQTMQ
jgi:hypothetical protein